MTPEHERLQAHQAREANWRQWGPYLAERAWGTVREDYSDWGDAWGAFPHEHARSRAYRWNEDGLMGISDRHQTLCFALALWNGRDTFLKERLYGLTGPQGNHGEDVKEAYFYMDNTPTHSYMKMLYKYPQRAFPYARLRRENQRRVLDEPEYELLDTGIFDDDAYFDVFVEYSKVNPEDLIIQITVCNRGSESAPLTLLPTLWFRNVWSWGYPEGPRGEATPPPQLTLHKSTRSYHCVETHHAEAGTYYWYAERPDDMLFTENDTNYALLYGLPNRTPYVKDAFHRYVVDGVQDCVNPHQIGTKVAALYDMQIEAGGRRSVRLRLSQAEHRSPFRGFDSIVKVRKGEADAFYAAVQRDDLSDEARDVQRQAFAGMLWTKQFYYYDVDQWLNGDPEHLIERHHNRNRAWRHLVNFDIISMPDKWEYPWYATWDLAFHCITLVLIDPAYAKRQLELVTREWYMHPNGQLPAYEWSFDDVNPPVHAWAVMRVYQMEAAQTGVADRDFLEAMFHKLLLNFTWWVNRKDADGNNVFDGGFLGMDNISIFDRSAPLPHGGYLEQSDGTAWMGFFCIEMMQIALELARDNAVYQHTAAKFFEHFLRISTAMSDCDGALGYSLWDEGDGFFYDQMHLPDGQIIPLRLRSLVGLLPLLAVEVLDSKVLAEMPIFNRRAQWLLDNRPHLTGNIVSMAQRGRRNKRLMAMLTRERLLRVLAYLLDEAEFLAPYGIRSLSKYHESHPFLFEIEGRDYSVYYVPAESRTRLFGGNSNWRGPIWFPLNYLIIEALRKYHSFYGQSLKVEYPRGSGRKATLETVADDLSRRLIGLFMQDDAGNRPINQRYSLFDTNPHWRNHVLFYEYFDGDNGTGLGASHQTGWTGLVANLLQQIGG